MRDLMKLASLVAVLVGPAAVLAQAPAPAPAGTPTPAAAVAAPADAAPADAAPRAVNDGGMSAFVLVLNEGKRLSAQGKYYDAALVFHKILAEGDEAQPYYQEAQYELGVALFQLKLYVSSFNYFDRVADVGPDHVRYRETLPWLLRIHRELPGETNTLYRMAAYAVDAYPPDLAEEIGFFVGQHYYYEGSLGKALDSLSRVGPGKPELYVKGTYLKGVVQVRKNEAGPASESFKEVLRFLKDHPKVNEARRYEQMAVMALARIFYSTQQFDTSIRYYDQISDRSGEWLDSLFEKSWAYYMATNYARALGNLQTVASPYFEEEYYPEAYVLKAVIFFKNCHYEEALSTIDPFYKEYYDVLKELEAALAAHPDPADFYSYLASVSVKGGRYSLKVKRIFNAALTDKKLKRLFEFVVHMSREIAQLEELKKHPVARGMAAFLIPDLVAYRSLTIGEAGKLARERLARVGKELKGLLAQALKVRFESLNAQKGILEERFRLEQVVEKAGAKPDTRVAIDAEHILWPYDGESWKDELGSYYYPLSSLCGTAGK
ncbi:MAG: hypothetical protein FJ087_13835 [Deltaproteobacteria bacterium]|nr:hypothetical protein [Deltaproteobacteria bacterium]